MRFCNPFQMQRLDKIGFGTLARCGAHNLAYTPYSRAPLCPVLPLESWLRSYVEADLIFTVSL